MTARFILHKEQKIKHSLFAMAIKCFIFLVSYFWAFHNRLYKRGGKYDKQTKCKCVQCAKRC